MQRGGRRRPAARRWGRVGRRTERRRGRRRASGSGLRGEGAGGGRRGARVRREERRRRRRRRRERSARVRPERERGGGLGASLAGAGSHSGRSRCPARRASFPPSRIPRRRRRRGAAPSSISSVTVARASLVSESDARAGAWALEDARDECGWRRTGAGGQAGKEDARGGSSEEKRENRMGRETRVGLGIEP